MVADFSITRLSSGGIITNYHCTSACRHCLYRSSPRRDKRYLDRETAAELFECVRSLGCASVHIGGGEPMLKPGHLASVLKTAAAQGVQVDYVETNSSWYTDAASAEKILQDLRSAGLTTLLVSISPFHNEFIPFSKIQGVMQACRRTGISIFPWIAEFAPDLAALDPTRPHALEEYTERFGEDYLRNALQRYWIHMGGRALELVRPTVRLKIARRILRENPGDCARELSDASHFHIDLYGNYIPGLCSGLSIDYADLGRPLSPERYPILTTLSRSGISGLVELARSKWGFDPTVGNYVNKCDLCTAVRTWLGQRGFDRGPELKPQEFYAQGIYTAAHKVQA